MIERIRNRNVDEVIRAIAHPSRILSALLLLAVFALAIHVESARYAQPLEFAGSHILHGDLRPDTDAPARVLALVAMPLAAILFHCAILAAQPLRRTLGEASDELRFHPSILRYLSRLFRAPPRSPGHAG